MASGLALCEPVSALSRHSFEAHDALLLSLGADMRRREFIALGSAAAVAGPTVASAQPSQIPVVGFLRVTSAADATNLVSAFRQGLVEAGFIEGRNIAIEYRWADGHGDRMPRLAADLINRQVAAIVGHSSAVMAAKAATTTIPIVAVVGDDPVRTGMVANLNRPGGNVTGVSFGTIDVSGKRLGLLRELVPQSNVLAALLDTNLVEFDQELRFLEAAAKVMGRRLMVVRVATGTGLGCGIHHDCPIWRGRIAYGKRSFFHFSAATPSVAFDAPCNSDQLHGS